MMNMYFYNVELMREIGALIEKFGFPVAFGIVMMVFIFILTRFFMRTIDKKDCDFKEYVDKRDKQFIDLSEKHIDATNKFAEAVNNNTSAIHEWKNSVKHRAGQSKVTAKILKDVIHEIKENPVVGIPKPDVDLDT